MRFCIKYLHLLEKHIRIKNHHIFVDCEAEFNSQLRNRVFAEMSKLNFDSVSINDDFRIRANNELLNLLNDMDSDKR